MCLLFLPSSTTTALHVSILNYNINAVGALGTTGRESLQRILDHFDPDIIIFQEAKGTTNPDSFLAVNSDYEGYYSSGDGAHNRRMIMSKYDIIDASVREFNLGIGSLRTLYAATIDIPGDRDIEIFTAHWHASNVTVRDNESAESVSVIADYNQASPDSFYIYTGDFNDIDSHQRVTNLLDPNTGLNITTPVDSNNGSMATINSDPAKGTYLDRRIDYILLSDALDCFDYEGTILNTWSYTAQAIPSGLNLTDTIDSSDHLPMFMTIEIVSPVDLNGDAITNAGDFSLLSQQWGELGCSGRDNCFCNGADINRDGEVDIDDLQVMGEEWLNHGL